MTEAQMAARVVRWLEDDGWSVYQEVEPIGLWGPGRADIVAVNGWRTRVVECKRALSFELLAQAQAWIQYAHWVDIAVPAIKASAEQSAGRNVAYKCAGMLGLGVLRVKSLHGIEEGVVSPVDRIGEDPPAGEPRPGLLDLLRPEHKTHAKAGEPGGGQWTRFKQTAAALRDFAANSPGETLRTALHRVEHHYASVRNALMSIERLGDESRKFGFEMRYSAEGMRLYPTTETG